MRKIKTIKKLALSSQTIRALGTLELEAVAGGGQQSNVCTKKNSECNACGGTTMM